ncbi:SCO2525 family SAM-dependent methyltransferase [Streptomyces sp. NPDC057757]|uniref:SCO2525 family SAM-dependent methyltransferase n=1 Tax=Streptomyces sp. NPDC057757 TaxID=3346241 RepID=UPI0036C062EE
MDSRSREEVWQLNTEAPWDHFDPLDYVDHNYLSVLAEDEEIISVVRSHFSDHFQKNSGPVVQGIDVGSGANLYPAFLMLPWCEKITLLDRSSANVRYLERQVDRYDSNWDQFWDILCGNGSYAALGGDPRERFRRVVRSEKGDLFDLLRREGYWSLGTMFFVAESLSTSHEKFESGVECFLRSLAPGAPFAAAFMEHSKGYWVGGNLFPACDVNELQVRESINRYARDVKTRRLGQPNVVREGYTGMIVAWGLRNPDA